MSDGIIVKMVRETCRNEMEISYNGGTPLSLDGLQILQWKIHP
jgi:hypothetical protein